MPSSLAKRLLVTLLLSAALPLVSFSWFALSGARERMERRTGDVYLPQLASDAAANLAARLEQMRRSLALLVAPASAALASAPRLRDFEQQAKLLPGVNDEFDLILLLGADGGVRHAHENPRLDPTTRASRRALLPGRVDAAWFAAVRGGAGEVWVDRHLSPFLHRSPERQSRDPAEHHLGVALGVPGANPGVLYALCRWDRIQDGVEQAVGFLRKPDEASLPSVQCALVDARGVALAHTERARYGDELVRESARPRVMVATRAPVSFVDQTGQARRGGVARVEGLPSNLQWWLILHAREDELFATSRDFARLLIAAVAVLLVVLIAWSLFASRAIVRPVRELADATRRLAQGDLEARVAAPGRDELGDLGRAFNQMTEDLQRSREQLRQAERQAAWAEMARQVAHEIKNPLTPMRMSAQLLQRARRDGDARWPELAERLAKTVLDQTDVLARIAGEFRQFAGPARRQVAEVAVAALLEDARQVSADVAAARGAELKVAAPEVAVSIVADRQELGRVLLNLIQNALEAGAKLVEVTAQRDGDALSLAVRDDGAGIPVEQHAKLFDPYFTTKTSGTGLGLAICRRVVEAHGGEIRLLRSQPGETVFALRLPLTAATPPAPPPAP